jgi:hypothetical protein
VPHLYSHRCENLKSYIKSHWFLKVFFAVNSHRPVSLYVSLNVKSPNS